MGKQQGQGLIGYVLMFVLIVVVIILLIYVFSRGVTISVCDYARPTAGNVVDCIATRTAEAKTR